MKKSFYRVLFERKYNGLDFLLLFYIVKLSIDVNVWWILLALPLGFLSVAIDNLTARYFNNKPEA